MTDAELTLALPTMKVHQIALFINQTWLDKNGQSAVNYAALPYLEAMGSIENVSDRYGMDNGMDNGEGIVLPLVASDLVLRIP